MDRGTLGEGRRTRISDVSNPIGLAGFREGLAAEGARRRGGEPVLAIVGQITPWKGHDIVVRALVQVRRRHPGTRLRIVGAVKFADAATRLDNPGYLEELRRLVGELGLEEAVELTGERRDIPEIMAAANAVLVPSEEEPFGRTVAEAMVVGTPVIATTVGGPAELIEDGVSGLLAPPGKPEAWSEAICRVLDDPEQAREMAMRAAEVARRRFAPERHVEAMTEIYAAAERRAGEG